MKSYLSSLSFNASRTSFSPILISSAELEPDPELEEDEPDESLPKFSSS